MSKFMRFYIPFSVGLAFFLYAASQMVDRVTFFYFVGFGIMLASGFAFFLSQNK